MKLIKPSYEIMTPINGEEILKQIELAARTCYKSEGKIEYEDEIIKDGFGGHQHLKDKIAKSARPLISKLIKNGHEAMIEFGGMITVRFLCDRAVSHELVRMRLASFAQESTRYCNYGKDEHIQFIIPSFTNIPEGTYEITWDKKLGTCPSDPTEYESNDNRWFWHMALAERDYNRLVKHTDKRFRLWSAQEARSVLPNSVKTEINLSANVREMRHILKLRTATAAHPQMQELMRPLLDEFKERIPILFDDITY
jgi:thymidylate synthase (FAD)